MDDLELLDKFAKIIKELVDICMNQTMLLEMHGIKHKDFSKEIEEFKEIIYNNQ